MENRWLMAAVVLVGVPLVIIGYIVLTERVLRLLPAARRDGVRPWLWLAPAIIFVGVFLIYPTIRTVILSFMDARSENFIGLDNYVEFFGTFFSPGGVRYQPLTHWTPVPPGPGQEA